MPESDKDLAPKDPRSEVIAKMEKEGFKFVYELEGLPLNYPNRQELREKLIGQDLDPVADLLDVTVYAFVDAPLLEYPEGVDTQGNEDIDAKDVQMRSRFASEGEEMKVAFESVIASNKYRVGMIQNAVSSIDFLPDLVPDPSGFFNKVNAEIKDVTNLFGSYKSTSKENKIKVIKKAAKATEMVLRHMNGEEVADQDFDTLRNI